MEYSSPLRGFKLTTLVVIGTDCAQVVVNPTTIRLRRPRVFIGCCWCRSLTQNSHRDQSQVHSGWLEIKKTILFK